MKTMLVPVTSYDVHRDTIDTLKAQIIEYLGTKVVENRLSDTPYIELNTILPKEDKEWIVQRSEKTFANSGGTILFFEYEERISSDDVTTVIIKEEEEEPKYE
jgi:hypothetical protein